MSGGGEMREMLFVPCPNRLIATVHRVEITHTRMLPRLLFLNTRTSWSRARLQEPQRSTTRLRGATCHLASLHLAPESMYVSSFINDRSFEEINNTNSLISTCSHSQVELYCPCQGRRRQTAHCWQGWIRWWASWRGASVFAGWTTLPYTIRFLDEYRRICSWLDEVVQPVKRRWLPSKLGLDIQVLLPTTKEKDPSTLSREISSFSFRVLRWEHLLTSRSSTVKLSSLCKYEKTEV